MSLVRKFFSGVSVMITIFGDVRQFSAIITKTKKQCCDKFSALISVILRQNRKKSTFE
jgi:hypothetical protein